MTVDGVEVAEYGYGANGSRTSARTASGTSTAVFDAHDRLFKEGAAKASMR